MKKELDLTYRVLRLPRPLLDALRRARDAGGTTNAEFIADAVAAHLPRVLDGLRSLGLTALKGARRPARLPFSTLAGTWKMLRAAGNETGLPALQLLCLCLVASSNAGVPGSRRRRRRAHRREGTEASGTQAGG